MAYWKPGQPNPPMKNLPGGGSSNNNSNNNKNNKGNSHKGKVVVENKIKLQNGSKVSMLTPATSSSSSAEAPILSKSVMSMKFMQRKTAEQEQIQHAKAATSTNTTGEDWFRTDRFVGNPASSKKIAAASKLGNTEIVKVADEVDMYAQLPGRRSFNGCNKAMEKHYQQIIDDKYLTKQQLASKEENNKVTITDEEMAERYEQLVSLPRGPNQGKRPASAMKHDRSDHKPKKHKK